MYNQEINLFKEANSIKKTPAEINDILNNIVIDTVLLPEDIDDVIKSYLNTTTNPDLCLQLTVYEQTHYESFS